MEQNPETCYQCGSPTCEGVDASYCPKTNIYHDGCEKALDEMYGPVGPDGERRLPDNGLDDLNELPAPTAAPLPAAETLTPIVIDGQAFSIQEVAEYCEMQSLNPWMEAAAEYLRRLSAATSAAATREREYAEKLRGLFRLVPTADEAHNLPHLLDVDLPAAFYAAAAELGIDLNHPQA